MRVLSGRLSAVPLTFASDHHPRQDPRMSPAKIKHRDIDRSGSSRALRPGSWGARIAKTFTSAIGLVLKGVISAVRRVLRAIVEALFSELF